MAAWRRRDAICIALLVLLHVYVAAAIAAATCPNCPPPATRAEDALRLDAIKRQILTKLGLRHKPNVTAATHVPREIILETLFRAADPPPAPPPPPTASSAAAATTDADDFYGRTSEVISFAEQGHRVNGNRLLEFRVSVDAAHGGAQEFRVRSATLWLKADVRHARSAHCKSTEIYVFKFTAALARSVRINSKEFNDLTMDPVALQLDEAQPGWQKVDVSRTVRDWLEAGEPSDRLRLLVDCSCCANWHVRLFNPPPPPTRSSSTTTTTTMESEEQAPPTPPQHRPFLVVHTDPTMARRVRRRALDCDVGAGSQCCKQRFYVSFKELGWDDWIIAPQGYYANYCRGDCGQLRTPDTYVTYHTHVIEEVRKTHHLSGMQPCCAPLKFASMSLIYYGPDANIIKRDLPKMVVDECGCP